MDVKTWKDYANCKGMTTEDFFPARLSKSSIEKISEIFAICENCEVNAECLQEAIIYDDLGVWGRTTYLQRQQFIEKVLKYDLSTYSLNLDVCRNFIELLSSNNVQPDDLLYESQAEE